MSLIKKIDVPKHLAARRAARQFALRPAIQPRATVISETEPAGMKANAANFGEAFSLEHSSPKVLVPAKD